MPAPRCYKTEKKQNTRKRKLDLVYVNVCFFGMGGFRWCRNACAIYIQYKNKNAIVLYPFHRLKWRRRRRKTRKICFWQSNTCLMSCSISKMCLALLHHPEYIFVCRFGLFCVLPHCRLSLWLNILKRNVWMNFGWIVAFKWKPKSAKMQYMQLYILVSYFFLHFSNPKRKRLLVLVWFASLSLSTKLLYSHEMHILPLFNANILTEKLK